MTLPKSVRIGYLNYKVCECDQDELEGDFQCGSQRLRVRTKDRSKAFAANTLIHEIVHGVFFHEGLKNLDGMTHEREEMLVNCMANGLTQVIKDNPKLIKYLQDALK